MKYIAWSIVIIVAGVLVYSWVRTAPPQGTSVVPPQGETPNIVGPSTPPTTQSPTETPKTNTIISTKTIQGMKVDVTKEGTGPAITNGKTAVVHYTGKLENGTVFDSSKARGPFEFPLGAGMVIKGWDLGVLGMKVGETRILTIPADLAYGQSGVPGAIPPNATLIFEVELLGIK